VPARAEEPEDPEDPEEPEEPPEIDSSVAASTPVKIR
jgi:hypothetical protein